jgi:hypothetical protein
MINNAVTKWLFQKDLSPGDIAMATGASVSMVSVTLKGELIDARVIDFLRKKGCPDLPDHSRQGNG